MVKVPTRYIPKNLTKKDKKKQIKELKKSRKAYKKNKYYTRKKVKSFKSKRTGWAKKVEKIYDLPKNGSISIAELQRKTGCKKSALDKIIKKGMGAYYSSGSRPNQTAHSWGRARLFSALSGGPASKVDINILEKGCPKNSKTLKLARKAKPIRKTRKTKIGGKRTRRKSSMKSTQIKRKLSLYNPKTLNDALNKAIDNLDLNNIKKILESGADVNYLSTYKESPLSTFLMEYYDDVEPGEIIEDKFNIAKLLIDKGANVNHINIYDYNQTPLSYAVKGYTGPAGPNTRPWETGALPMADTRLVNLLINNGADVNAISNGGETPLIAAIKNGNNNNDVIQLLLERGTKKNIIDDFGYKAFDYVERSLPNFRLQLQPGDPLPTEDDPIFAPLRWRLPYLFSRDRSGAEALQEFHNDMLDIYQIFRDYEAQTAMERRKVDEATLRKIPGDLRNKEIKSYLRGGANNEEGDLENELYEAVGNDDKEEVKRLIKSGADVNKPAPAFDNDYPLKRAWELEDINMIKLLIKNGAYVNIELDDKEWATAPGLLHDAVERARADLVEILLEGKDISAARKGEIVFYPPNGWRNDSDAAITPEKLLELYISNTEDGIQKMKTKKKEFEKVHDVFNNYDKQKEIEKRGVDLVSTKGPKDLPPELRRELKDMLGAGKNKMKEKIIKFKKSERNGKKYMVIVENKKTGKQRTLHFGATGYEQFKDSTPLKLYSKGNHGDPNRRRNYFNRHSGTPYKNKAVHKESQTGLYTPKLLSHIYLW